MNWQKHSDKNKITNIINNLIVDETRVNILFPEIDKQFSSKFTHIKQEGIGKTVIIEKLSPEEGNGIIQSATDFSVEFEIKRNKCRCRIKYMGISNTHPYYGFLVEMPQSIEVIENRRDERVQLEEPDFVSAEFSITLNKKEKKTYEFPVLDCSTHGLGVLVTKKNFDLFNHCKIGDKIKNITFYATWAMIKVDGFIRHATKIKGGKFKGCYILGFECPDIIKSCKSNNG